MCARVRTLLSSRPKGMSAAGRSEQLKHGSGGDRQESLLDALGAARYPGERTAAIDALRSRLGDPPECRRWMRDTPVRSMLAQCITDALNDTPPHPSLLVSAVRAVQQLVQHMRREDIVECADESKALVKALKLLKKSKTKLEWSGQQSIQQEAAGLVSAMERIAGKHTAARREASAPNGHLGTAATTEVPPAHTDESVCSEPTSKRPRPGKREDVKEPSAMAAAAAGVYRTDLAPPNALPTRSDVGADESEALIPRKRPSASGPEPTAHAARESKVKDNKAAAPPRTALATAATAPASSAKTALHVDRRKRVTFAPGDRLATVHHIEWVPGERTHAPINIYFHDDDDDDGDGDGDGDEHEGDQHHRFASDAAGKATDEWSAGDGAGAFSEVAEEGRLMQRMRQRRRKALDEMHEEAAYYTPPHVFGCVSLSRYAAEEATEAATSAVGRKTGVQSVASGSSEARRLEALERAGLLPSLQSSSSSSSISNPTTDDDPCPATESPAEAPTESAVDEQAAGRSRFGHFLVIPENRRATEPVLPNAKAAATIAAPTLAPPPSLVSTLAVPASQPASARSDEELLQRFLATTDPEEQVRLLSNDRMYGIVTRYVAEQQQQQQQQSVEMTPTIAPPLESAPLPTTTTIGLRHGDGGSAAAYATGYPPPPPPPPPPVATKTTTTTAVIPPDQRRVAPSTGTSTGARPRKVCKYALQGKCRYGDKCWFVHPRNA